MRDMRIHQKYYSLVQHLITAPNSNAYRNIHLKDATLVVRPSGREKVLRERRKNVHAFIRGYIKEDYGIKDNWYTVQELSYNPYKANTFVVKETGVPVHNASKVYLNTNGKAYMESD